MGQAVLSESSRGVSGDPPMDLPGFLSASPSKPRGLSFRCRGSTGKRLGLGRHCAEDKVEQLFRA